MTTPEAGRVPLFGKKLEDWLMGFLVCGRDEIQEKLTTQAETIRRLEEQLGRAMSQLVSSVPGPCTVHSEFTRGCVRCLFTKLDEQRETIRRLEGEVARLTQELTDCRAGASESLDLILARTSQLVTADQRAEAAEGRVRELESDIQTLKYLAELPLLFHHGGPWTDRDRNRWTMITGEDEATTKVMCDTIRNTLAVLTPATGEGEG